MSDKLVGSVRERENGQDFGRITQRKGRERVTQGGTTAGEEKAEEGRSSLSLLSVGELDKPTQFYT